MSAWYYSDYERNRHGPVSADDLTMLHANNQLPPETLVWREGMPEWKPWREMMGEVIPQTGGNRAESRFASVSTSAAMPNTSARVFGGDPYNSAETHSPYAPPRASLQGSGGVYQGANVVYAGFWKRAAAYIIDAFVAGIIGAMVGGVVGGIMGAGGANALTIQAIAQIISLLLGIAYYAGFHASSLQATPGKMAIGIKVVRSDGDGISFLRGVGRYFGLIVSALILCFGFIMAGFTERKRALHDMICDTVVVDKWAYTASPEQQREELGTVTIVVLVLGGGLILLGVAAVFAAIGLAGR